MKSTPVTASVPVIRSNVCAGCTKIPSSCACVISSSSAVIASLASRQARWISSAPRRFAVLAQSNATFPPPRTMILLPMPVSFPILAFLRKSAFKIVPGSSLPSIGRRTPLCPPIVISTASYSFSNSAGFSTFVFTSILTPCSTITFASSAMISLGRR